MLGPTQRGIYFLVITTTYILSGFLTLGMGISNQIFLAKGKYKLGELNSNSIIYSLGTGMITFICFYFLKITLLNIF
jgi:hypothetical protein